MFSYFSTKGSNDDTKSFYDLSAKDIKGQEVSFETYRDKKAILVVNVANLCGLTKSNYPELQSLYDKYKDQGFTVLAFPCNQFMGQEPGTDAEIETKTCSLYNVTFPLFSKIDVNGADEHPVYGYLKSKKSGVMGLSVIKWNFEKFLVVNGEPVQRYAPTTNPLSLEGEIRKYLNISDEKTSE